MPKFESEVSSQDDNPFAGIRSQAHGKVSVKLPPDDWLCRKLEKLNLTRIEGYPSLHTDTIGLCKDQFVKVPNT